MRSNESVTIELNSVSAGIEGRRTVGRGLLVATLLLFCVEMFLHTDAFLHRFRSVFAAGRALDKVVHVEAHPPDLLILGNSRADNGFDPRTVQAQFDLSTITRTFNMGLPSADTRVLAGVVDRLERSGVFGKVGVRHVVLSLDESLVQPIDSLGQEVFFANVPRMWADGQHRDALRAVFRLYGYSDNLRQLREPAVLERFIHAARRDVPPVGGAAAVHLGYRRGVGGLQDQQSVQLQEAESVQPPSAVNVSHLWRMLDLLASRGVQVAVVFPPLLNRNVLYLESDRPDAVPYSAIAAELQRRGIPVIVLDREVPRTPAEFVNPGHLNDRGAQRYSVLLGRALASIWHAGSGEEGPGSSGNRGP